MEVKDLMNPHVWSVRPHETLDAATRIMWNEDIGALPVVDEWNHPVGMVTDRDIAMSAAINGQPLGNLTVANCMSRRAYSCLESDTIDAAAGVMRAHQVRRLPVVDEEQRLVGVLTLNDIVRAGFGDANARTRRAICDEVVRTLHAVTEPREGKVEGNAIVEVQPARPASKAVKPKATRSTGRTTRRKASR